MDLSASRPLKVVVDAGNGMGGYTVPAVLGDAVLEPLPLEIVPLYFELDGSFPNHEANPLEPANLVDLQRRVVEVGADIGLAFDGDADRCFVVDADGNPVSPSAITALVAVRELAKAPGSAVIHNLITSKAVPEIIAAHGGRPVRTRVGHSYIKAEMAVTDAVFGGEHSAHYYFRDFWRADTGMLAAMHVLAALGEQDGTLAALTAELRALPRLRRDQLQGGRPGRPGGRGPRALRRPDRGHRHPGRPHHRAGRRLLAQRPGLQHRTPAAAQRRSPHQCRAGRSPRRGAGRHPVLGGSSVSISADLLSILACPSADHAPLRLETSGERRAAGLHVLPEPVPGHRRHPGAARRRGGARPARPGQCRPTAGRSAGTTRSPAAARAPADRHDRDYRVNSFQQELLDDPQALIQADRGGLLRALAGAGAQVRRSIETVAEFGVDRLRGSTAPRAVLVAAGRRRPVPVQPAGRAGLGRRAGDRLA